MKTESLPLSLQETTDTLMTMEESTFDGTSKRRKTLVGNVEAFPIETSALKAAKALRIDANQQAPHAEGSPRTVAELIRSLPAQRHAYGRITLDVYTQAVNSHKRAAQSKVVKTMVPNLGETAAI